MITKEECMEIKIFSRQGISIREIQRFTGYSRNTIRKFLRSAATLAYKKRGHEQKRPAGDCPKTGPAFRHDQPMAEAR